MNNINIFFKAESNTEIGGGHLNRSISLANALKSKNINIEFIFANTPKSIISNIPFKKNFIDKNKELDVESYTKIIPKNSLILFDTDDYRFYSGKLIDGLRKYNVKTACFTITDKYQFNTDIIINSNIIALKQNFNCSEQTIKLLGPKYLILNKIFSNYTYPYKDTRNNKNLLLFFGNADKNNLTKLILKNICKIEDKFDAIKVIIGNLNSNKEQIQVLISECNLEKIKLYINISYNEIVDIYSKTNIAISSAGMAMWEMALFDIKQIIIASSRRESEYTDYLNDLKYIYKLGNYNNLYGINDLDKIIESEKFKNIKINEFKSIINTNGIEAIAEVFIKLAKNNYTNG